MNTLRLGIDGISQATPLDTFKTSVRAGHSVEQIMQYPIYSGILAGAGWQWVNLAWLAGGVWLLWQKAIRWHIPLSFLVTLALCATLGWLFSPETLAAPQKMCIRDRGVDIIHEYTVAAPAAGLSREQIRQAQINGLEMAFLSAEEKRALREKVAAK